MLPPSIVTIEKMASERLTNSNNSDNVRDLEQSIVSLRQAVHNLPKGNPYLPHHLYELGNLLHEHYIAANGEGDPTEVLFIAREAVKVLPDDSPMAATYLHNLGRLLRHKFDFERDPRDLDEAVEVFRRSVDLSKEDGRSWLQWLTDLGNSIYTRYNITGSLQDLEESIELARRALDDTAEDDPEMIDLVINLMVRLRTQSKRTGFLSASEEAINMAKKLLESSPEKHPSRSSLLHLLAGSFSDRHVFTGAMDDLNGHIMFSRQAIDATSIDDPERVTRLAGLAVGLRDRYARTGALGDLSEAIRIATMAFEQTQEGSDDWATHACNLSGYILTLYQRSGEQLDLDKAIALGRASVDATPIGNALRHIRLGNLTASLIARFDSTGSFEDLEECVKMGDEAKEATPEEHIEWPARLHDLAAIMQRRYQMTEELEDLDEAIGLTQQALFALGPDHPQQADTMSLIALFFAKRFGETESPEDLQRTEFFYRAALFQTQSPVVTRIEAGVKLISVCMVQQNMEQAYEDAKSVVDLIPQMAVRSLESSDKQDLLLKIGGVSSEAAGLALHLGEDPLVALSLLEKGRGIFALSLDEMRADIKSLEEQYPDLASKFITLREQLSAPSGTTLDIEDPEWNVDASRRHEAGDEFERLLAEIRQQSGFETFLLPPSESEIRSAADRGPIIIINTSMLRCDAILVESHQITSVPLANFNRRDMIEYVKTGTFRSDEALQWLWDCVASPVLSALGFEQPPSEGDWPHVWWIMTGLLNKFPIHAAGHHSKGYSETVIDRVISSYHSSIRSIIRGRMRPISAATQTHALLVAMEATPGSSKLPFATREITVIRGLCKSMLVESEEPEPNRDDVLTSLLECGIFHFAGHACTDPEDPIGSYLCLDQEREKCLTVLDLLDINLQSRSPFLAYLSACGTGRIENNDLADEGIHLINGFHTAGFRHVIGTLWEVKDEICVDMARITYEGIMQNGMTDKAVSQGLHNASRELRDRWVTMASADHRTVGSLQARGGENERGDGGENERRGHEGFSRDIVTCDDEPVWPPWIPYIHYGV
jgi:tetratricopeptide (TPR) repeat protein